MNLTVHTYGYYDALHNTLQALAMFRNAEFYTILVNAMCLLTGCYYALQIANSTNQAQWRTYIYKTLGMLIIINSLLLPKTEMLIKDHVTKRIAKVDNIPLAFALPVGILEDFGQAITVGFEQAFRPFSGDKNFDYFNYGMLFGERLKHEVSQSRIKDPEFVGNIQNFIKRCVVLPAMIGHQFTKEQLMSTSNIWKLVSAKAGTLTRLDMHVDGVGRTSMNCKDAAKYFEENSWKNEGLRIFQKYENTEFAKANNGSSYNLPTNNLNKFFDSSLKKVYQGNGSALQILQQQMMINSISDYRSSSYGIARARTQQESSALLSSDMASIYLPMMLVVFKCIVYGAFIFLVPMLIFSGGWAKYKSYLIVIISLQLWPSLNAILNMIMETYSNLSKGSSMIMSYSTASTIDNRIDTIVSVAAGLQMIIPLLAMWLTNLGAGGIMHLAGNIVGGMQSVSGSVGAETATNNKSLDNLNTGNQQRNMISANKTDQSMSYFSGVNHGQYGDGTSETITSSGNQVFAGGRGTTSSVGETSYSMDQNRRAEASNGIQTNEALVKSDQRSLSEAKSNTFARTVDRVANIAEREHAGESFNYDELGEQGMAMQQAVNQTKQLKEQNNYGWNQAALSAIEASASAGINILGSGATLTARGTLSATNSADQSIGQDDTISRDNNTNESYNNLVKAASNESWAKDTSIDKSQSDAVRSSYEEQMRLEKQLSVRQETLDSYHKAANVIDSQGANNSRDMTEEVINRCMTEWGTGDKYAVQKAVSNRTPEVMKVWNKMQSEDQYVQKLVSNINAGKNNVSGANAQAQLNNFSEANTNQVNNNPNQRIAEIAQTDGGININEARHSVQSKKEPLQKKLSQMTGHNSEQYSNVKKANEWQEIDKSAQVNKYTENSARNFTQGNLGLGKSDTVEAKPNIGAYSNAKQKITDN